jgi:ubiquinone/menaquinone biosynthesis C-methylase UbiE
MPTSDQEAVGRQREYYAATARDYDGMHIDPEHDRALRHVASLIRMLGVSSVLDVGCGTGRAMDFLMSGCPDVDVRGIEPVEALIKQAGTDGKASAARMFRATGTHLPFADRSFDCVCEFAVLHHVSDPRVVVGEMTRVARRLVCLSDENRFGMVGFPRNLLQFIVFKSGQWRRFYWVWTRGKGYQYSEGDGVRYSYSVYDSFDQLAAWGDHLVLFPTALIKPKSWMHPLFTSSHVLLCAYRDDPLIPASGPIERKEAL